ncbi:PQQ-dependent sugar dehydrogenase [Nitrosopumilus sp. K4]|uniref:PQQ-dependent sugar dehydrogenase n=1 Tax=Nitrosopumilus sp. K4 TaxID=2795383 RepID=UPI001BAE4B35|nr:PQQ-dependent sugar dehydrogenase [Nitrosopumilus sp. K4]QUC64158.1 PQQ-dependent sugar dehydrogenase [Nitrosopumilus sp. K4]
MKIAIILSIIISLGVSSAYAVPYPEYGVNVKTVAENLSVPWSIDFAADGRIFFSERTGQLNVIEDGIIKQVMSLDVGGGEGGMLGVALDPDFEQNHYIYIYYTYNDFLSTKNKLVRYVEWNDTLVEDKVLIDEIPGAPYHDGGRIKFGPDGKLYITTGDATLPDLSQDSDSVAGKILRINPDGMIPEDNPFGNAVYSMGHRNPQGIDWDRSGVLVATEHGPSGWRGVAHDEINIIHSGANYGWPDVIGDETLEGATSPAIHSGDDTWAPSGAAFYYGNIIHWNGKFFAATLRGEHLHQIEFDENYNVIHHEKLFPGEFGRLRDAVNGPDGLYIMTSNQDGRGNPKLGDDKILKITPYYDTENGPAWIQNIIKWYNQKLVSEQELLNAFSNLATRGIIATNS